MVREIVRDQLFLSQRLDRVAKDDDYKKIADDLRDTLQANSKSCVGMTANMIGERKQIIIVSLGFAPLILINPKIMKKSGKYETEEGCLSLDGVRKCTRYRNITVEYLDMDLKRQKQDFAGFIAQNIQHQCDHCNGVVI